MSLGYPVTPSPSVRESQQFGPAFIFAAGQRPGPQPAAICFLDLRPEPFRRRGLKHGKGVVLACLDCGSQNVGPIAIGAD